MIRRVMVEIEAEDYWFASEEDIVYELRDLLDPAVFPNITLLNNEWEDD